MNHGYNNNLNIDLGKAYENFLESKWSGEYYKGAVWTRSEEQKDYAQRSWELTGGRYGTPREDIGKYWGR